MFGTSKQKITTKYQLTDFLNNFFSSSKKSRKSLSEQSMISIDQQKIDELLQMDINNLSIEIPQQEQIQQNSNAELEANDPIQYTQNHKKILSSFDVNSTNKKASQYHSSINKQRIPLKDFQKLVNQSQHKKKHNSEHNYPLKLTGFDIYQLLLSSAKQNIQKSNGNEDYKIQVNTPIPVDKQLSTTSSIYNFSQTDLFQIHNRANKTLEENALKIYPEQSDKILENIFQQPAPKSLNNGRLMGLKMDWSQLLASEKKLSEQKRKNNIIKIVKTQMEIEEPEVNLQKKVEEQEEKKMDADQKQEKDGEINKINTKMEIEGENDEGNQAKQDKKGSLQTTNQILNLGSILDIDSSQKQPSKQKEEQKSEKTKDEESPTHEDNMPQPPAQLENKIIQEEESQKGAKNKPKQPIDNNGDEKPELKVVDKEISKVKKTLEDELKDLSEDEEEDFSDMEYETNLMINEDLEKEIQAQQPPPPPAKPQPLLKNPGRNLRHHNNNTRLQKMQSGFIKKKPMKKRNGFLQNNNKSFNRPQKRKLQSKSAMTKTNQILNNTKGTTKNAGFSGFSTGGGKKMKISAKALKKAEAMLAGPQQQPSNDRKQEKGDKVGGSFGFSTGGGKKLQVSEEALQKAKQRIGGEDAEDGANKPKDTATTAQFNGFSTGAGKHLKISEEQLHKAKTMLGGEGNPTNNPGQLAESKPKTTSPAETFGFSTGAGKKLQISKEQIQKAKSMLGEPADPTKPKDKPKTASFGFSTGAGKKLQISEDQLQKAKSMLGKSANPPKPKDKPKTASFGFSTGGGKKLQISKEQIQKAKAMLGETGGIVQEQKKEVKATSFGFSTGAGKKLKISDEQLKKAKNMLGEKIAPEVGDKDKNSKKEEESADKGFCGFSTGRGKKLKISEEKLKKAQTMLGNTPKEPKQVKKKPKVPSFGFSTGAGKKMEISEEQMKQAKARMGESTTQPDNQKTDDKPNKPKVQSFGFSTGAGKKMDISEEQMKKAEQRMGQPQPTQPTQKQQQQTESTPKNTSQKPSNSQEQQAIPEKDKQKSEQPPEKKLPVTDPFASDQQNEEIDEELQKLLASMGAHKKKQQKQKQEYLKQEAKKKKFALPKKIRKRRLIQSGANQLYSKKIEITDQENEQIEQELEALLKRNREQRKLKQKKILTANQSSFQRAQKFMRKPVRQK